MSIGSSSVYASDEFHRAQDEHQMIQTGLLVATTAGIKLTSEIETRTWLAWELPCERGCGLQWLSLEPEDNIYGSRQSVFSPWNDTAAIHGCEAS